MAEERPQRERERERERESGGGRETLDPWFNWILQRG